MKLQLFRFGFSRSLSARQFAAALRDLSLGDERSLQLTAVSAGRLSGVYRSKRIRTLQVFDVSGNTEVVKVETFEKFEFSFLFSSSTLVVYNPPRTLRVFLNDLAVATDFSIWVENRTLDPLAFAKRLGEGVDNLKGRRSIISDYPYSRKVGAILKLFGDSEIDDFSTRNLKGSAELRNLQVEFSYKNERIGLLISKGGMLAFSRNIDPNLMELVVSLSD